jgi:hypothetical protein
MIKPHFLMLPAMLIIAGCTSYTWVHPERDEAAMQADSLRCEALSLQMHPRNFQRYQTAPAVTKPDTTTCTTEGNRTRCVTEKGQTRPAQYSQRDVNSGARSSAFSRCMISMGYTQVEVK